MDAKICSAIKKYPSVWVLPFAEVQKDKKISQVFVMFLEGRYLLPPSANNNNTWTIAQQAVKKEEDRFGDWVTEECDPEREWNKKIIAAVRLEEDERKYYSPIRSMIE